MLYAAINPADYYAYLGVYGLKNVFPRTLGFEGVGEIIECG